MPSEPITRWWAADEDEGEIEGLGGPRSAGVVRRARRRWRRGGQDRGRRLHAEPACEVVCGRESRAGERSESSTVGAIPTPFVGRSGEFEARSSVARRRLTGQPAVSTDKPRRL